MNHSVKRRKWKKMGIKKAPGKIPRGFGELRELRQLLF